MGQSQEKFMYFNERVIGINNTNKDLCIIASINTKTNKVSNYCCRKVLLSAPLAISRSMAISYLSKVKRFILNNQLRANCVKSFLIVKKPFWPQVMPYSQAHILLICAMISLRMICHAESWYSSIMEKNTMNGSPDSNPN